MPRLFRQAVRASPHQRGRRFTRLAAVLMATRTLTVGRFPATAGAGSQEQPKSTEVALQAQLESSLASFGASEPSEAEQRQCLTVLTPFHQAETG